MNDIENLDCFLMKELFRQSLVMKNVAINLGYSEQEWKELQDRSVLMTEQEMLDIRNRRGHL